MVYLLANNLKEKDLISKTIGNNIILENENFRNALSHLLKLQKKDPLNDKIYYKLGLLYSHENKSDEAIEYFSKALSNSPPEIIFLPASSINTHTCFPGMHLDSCQSKCPNEKE